MSVETAITEIISDLRADVSGLTVYDTPPEQINDATAACVVYAGNGNVRPGAARGQTLPTLWGVHTLFIEVSVPRVDLVHDIPKVLPFVTTVPQALVAGFYRDRFNGSVTSLGDPTVRGGTGGTGSVRYGFVDSGAGGLAMVGYRFELDVAIEEEVST